MTAELNSFFAVPEGRNLLLLDFERTILYADLRRQLATVSIAVGDTRLRAPLDFFNKQDEKRSVHLVLLRLILKFCVVARPYAFFRSKLSFLFGHFMTVYYLLNRMYILKWDRFVIEYGTGTVTYVFQRAWEETLKCWWEWHIWYWRFVVCCRSFLRNSRHYGSITKLGIVGSAVNIRLNCQLIIGQRLAVTWDHYHRSSGLVIFWQFFVNLAHWLKFLQNFVATLLVSDFNRTWNNQQAVSKFPSIIQAFLYHLATHSFCHIHVHELFLVHVLIRRFIFREVIQ